jgi:transketolase
MGRPSFSEFHLAPRRAVFIDLGRDLDSVEVDAAKLGRYEDYDLIYRTLCGILFNFVPTSGHPGGSISSGRMVASLLFDTMDYDFSDPDRRDADVISYAAGHKAMGLYAMWALRNECARAARPDLLPDVAYQLRLEDLLGFRRNPTQETPLFREFGAKPLDGHPCPQTPFIKLSTGASGVGMPSSFGLAFGALDTYGADAPLVNVVEGEGGLTAGRSAEAMATAASAQLHNLRLHIDWNQSSIDSDSVTREGDRPGEYVQWTPAEFCYVNDWNVVVVPDGKDFRQVLAAQEIAKEKLNDQPTAVVYRTIKGWQYGIEGRKSHGAGHGFYSDEYFATLEPLEQRFGVEFPRTDRLGTPTEIEQAFFNHLLVVRDILEKNSELSAYFAERLVDASGRLGSLARKERDGAPDLSAIWSDEISADTIPESCTYDPGGSYTLRGALGDALGHLNDKTGGGFIGAAADLYGSTSISNLAGSFPGGFYNSVANPDARLIATGGICEDCMGAFMSGVSSFGSHIGAGSSYAAFIAALNHIAARLHGIGQQARKHFFGDEFRPFFVVCAHAGLKTGEDGPTHADPQAVQLLQENFPPGVMITLTPWDPQELYPLVVAALKKRPAIIAPFVTRPNEPIFDRAALGMPPATAAIEGLYAMRTADTDRDEYHGTIVLQGSGVTNAFVADVLPRIDEEGLNLNVLYVASAELFSMLPVERQREVFTPRMASEAMGITGLTMATMYRWVASPEGRQRTLHAYSKGRFPGSGVAHKVLEEMGLDGEAQWRAIRDYASWIAESRAGASSPAPALT